MALLLVPNVALAQPTTQASTLTPPPATLLDDRGRAIVDVAGHRILYSQSETDGVPSAFDTEVERPSGDGATPSTRRAAKSNVLDIQLEWHRGIYGTGIGATGLHIADLDGDGQTEVIAGGSPSGFSNNRFWYVLRHDGSGYPHVWISPPSTAAIDSIRLADVDGDGDSEVIVRHGFDLEIWDGVEPMLSRSIEIISGEFNGLHIVDVDLDGQLEIVWADSIWLYVYDYATGLEEWFAADLGGRDLAIGNIDDDPAPEIVIANSPGLVIDGVTGYQEWSEPAGFGQLVRLADIDGDGRDEIIAADAWNTLRVWDGDTQALAYSIASSHDIDALRVADPDSDGQLEILYGDGQWGSIHVHDAATGAFEQSISNPDHGVTDIAVGDADDDGDVDLLWGSGYSSTGADFLRAFDLGAGTVDWTSQHITGPFYAMAHGDVDADGAPELVSGCFDSNAGDDGLWFLHDAATKATELTSPEPTGTDFIGLHRVRVAQLDADPQLEVFVTSSSGYTPKVFVYDGSTHATEVEITGENGLRFLNLQIADVDLDGQLEVVASTGREHTGPAGVVLEIYDAATGTLEFRSSPLATNFSNFPYLRIAETDGDANPEIVVGGPGVWVFDGVTQIAQLSNVAGSVSSLDTADLDGDGLDEIVVGNSAGDIRVLDGTTGAVTATPWSLANRVVQGLQLADLDEDGELDFVFAADEHLRVVSGADYSTLYTGDDIELDIVAGQWDSILVDDVDQDGAQEIWLNLGERGSWMVQVGEADPVDPPPPTVGDYLARWTFDYGFDDISGNGHDGIGEGGVGFAAGVEDFALETDGQDDQVRVAADPALDTLSTFTVTAWVRASQEARWRSIVDKRDANADGFDLYFDSVGHPFLRVNQRTLTGAADLDDGTWHHVAAVWDGNQMSLYVDGALDNASTVTTGVVATTADLLIGGHFAGGAFAWAGGLDDVRLYARALDSAEIAIVEDEVPPRLSNLQPANVLPSGTTSTTLSVTTHEAAECRAAEYGSSTAWNDLTILFTTADDLVHEALLSGLSAGSYEYAIVCRDLAGHESAVRYLPVAIAYPSDVHLGLAGFWMLDEGSGTIAADANGAGHDGTVVGATWIASPHGYALDLSASGDRVEIAPAAAFSQPTTVTLAAWVRITGGSGYRSVIDVRDSNTDGYDLFVDGSGRGFIRVNTQKLTGVTSLDDGAWHHLAAVYDGSDLVIYVDGVEDARSTIGAQSINVAAGPRLGDHFTGSGQYGFRGGIDEVRIYNRVLGAAEVQYLADN